jgi:hypothetical protein
MRGLIVTPWRARFSGEHSWCESAVVDFVAVVVTDGPNSALELQNLLISKTCWQIISPCGFRQMR